MLNYPFPYDSVPVQRAMHGLATALVRALKAREGRGNEALAEVIAARDTLRRRLGSADYRYFEFQLWQEGVARYIEYAAARAAAKLGAPSKAFQRLPDYESYERVSERALLSLKRELEQLDLARARRVAFYPVGAAIAIVLQRTAPNWRERYTQRPFSLAALLAVSH
jgi:hypothetical protein